MKQSIIVILIGTILLSCGISIGAESHIDTSEDPDAKVLNQLKQAGSDLTKPHPVRFYLYFPDRKNAAEAGRILEEKGYVTVVRKGADEISWLCRATISIPPAIETIKEITKELIKLSSDLEGEYDGWEAPIIK